MHGRQQAGLGSCAEAGEAAHEDADDRLRGHHGQEGALHLLGSCVICAPMCLVACMPALHSYGVLVWALIRQALAQPSCAPPAVTALSLLLDAEITDQAALSWVHQHAGKHCNTRWRRNARHHRIGVLIMTGNHQQHSRMCDMRLNSAMYVCRCPRGWQWPSSRSL